MYLFLVSAWKMFNVSKMPCQKIHWTIVTHKPLEFLHIQTAQVSKSDNVLPQCLDITSHVSTMWAQQNDSPCYRFYRFQNASQQQNNNFMELLELHRQFKIQLFDLNCSSSSSFLKYGTLERTEIQNCFKGAVSWIPLGWISMLFSNQGVVFGVPNSLQVNNWTYGWWKKSCTIWYGKYPIIYRVLYVPVD